jgi:hypothetical protein
MELLFLANNGGNDCFVCGGIPQKTIRSEGEGIG